MMIITRVDTTIIIPNMKNMVKRNCVEMDKVSKLSGLELLRLMTFLSPAFPTGGFAWSSGLEAACRTGLVGSADDLKNWLTDSLLCGSLHNDAILCAATYRQEEGANETALALAGSRERFIETTSLGEAFANAADTWHAGHAGHAGGAEDAGSRQLPDPVALPVAVGLIACEQGFPLHETLIAYLQSGISAQVQAALRLMSLGQSAGLEVSKALEEVILNAADKALDASLDDLGSATFMNEIAAMRHETLNSRIFRS